MPIDNQMDQTKTDPVPDIKDLLGEYDSFNKELLKLKETADLIMRSTAYFNPIDMSYDYKGWLDELQKYKDKYMILESVSIPSCATNEDGVIHTKPCESKIPSMVTKYKSPAAISGKRPFIEGSNMFIDMMIDRLHEASKKIGYNNYVSIHLNASDVIKVPLIDGSEKIFTVDQFMYGPKGDYTIWERCGEPHPFRFLQEYCLSGELGERLYLVDQSDWSRGKGMIFIRLWQICPPKSKPFSHRLNIIPNITADDLKVTKRIIKSE